MTACRIYYVVLSCIKYTYFQLFQPTKFLTLYIFVPNIMVIEPVKLQIALLWTDFTYFPGSTGLYMVRTGLSLKCLIIISLSHN